MNTKQILLNYKMQLGLFLAKAKLRVKSLNISFEWILIAALIIITSCVAFTGILAYRSLIKLAEVMAESNKPEERMLLIKSIPDELASAESNVKSYALSREKEYLKKYYTSIAKVKKQTVLLDSIISDTSLQQSKLDSATYYVDQKVTQLKAFADMQQRWSVVNELNVLTYQIEQNKKLLAHYLKGKKKTVSKEDEEENKPGLFKRIFKSKEIKKEKEAKENKERSDIRNQLSSQIEMMQSVKGEIGNVKKRQGSKLKNIDQKELNLTQKNKAITEKLNAFFVSIEMDELVLNKKILADIDKRHKRSDTLIALFSVAGVIFLLIIGYVVFSFIRKKNAYQVALLAAKDEAEEYSLLQERFLANMSHEIRTPMNAISGFTEQLLKTPLKKEQQTHLNIIKQSVQYLLVIINDILDYAKLKADKLTIENIPFSVAQTVDETIQLLSGTGNLKEVKLVAQIDASIPESLLGDKVRLKQILLNIIGNALKFTEKGRVTVSVNCIEHTSEKTTVEIKVTDTGIGISEANLAKIFNAFEQAEVSTTRKYGGSGLGLSITQKLIYLLRGTLSIQSKEGKGTEIITVFNYDNVTQVALQKTTNKTSIALDTFTSFIKNKRILVADDDEWNMALLITVFEKLDVELVAVKDGKDAVEQLLKHRFDIVLMDVRMPELNGFEATKRIRMSEGLNADIPIIGLTANVSKQQVEQCLQAGMNAVFGKPFEEAKLYELMYNVLHQSKPIAVTINNAQQMGEAETARQVKTQLFSLDTLNEFGNEDNAYIVKMLNIYISNGDIAFAGMNEALQSNNFVAMESLAHKILPSTRYLEADSLLNILKQIEQQAIANNNEHLPELYEQAKAEFVLICESMRSTIKELNNNL
jgi:signal transduction histidine kinase/CheY-like chemotaxis protein